MGEKLDAGALITLPLVLGVIVVMGGIAALAVSGLFVYRAHVAKLETVRMQEDLRQASRENLADQQQPVSATQGSETAFSESSMSGKRDLPGEHLLTSAIDPTLKPGARLHAQRPAHWDEIEVIDVLEDNRVKVRWLSGEPGEDVIASDLVRGGTPRTN